MKLNGVEVKDGDEYLNRHFGRKEEDFFYKKDKEIDSVAELDNYDSSDNEIKEEPIFEQPKQTIFEPPKQATVQKPVYNIPSQTNAISNQKKVKKSIRLTLVIVAVWFAIMLGFIGSIDKLNNRDVTTTFNVNDEDLPDIKEYEFGHDETDEIEENNTTTPNVEQGELVLEIGPFYQDNYIENPEYGDVLGTRYTGIFFKNGASYLLHISESNIIKYEEDTDEVTSQEVYITSELYDLLKATYEEKELSDAEWFNILDLLKYGNRNYVEVMIATDYWGWALFDNQSVQWVCDYINGSLVLLVNPDDLTSYTVAQVYYDKESHKIKDAIIVEEEVDTDKLYDFIILLNDTNRILSEHSDEIEFYMWDTYMTQVIDILTNEGIDSATECCKQIQEKYQN